MRVLVSMGRYSRSQPATPFGIPVGIGAVAMVAAGVVAAMIPGAYPGWRFGVFAFAVFAFAAASLDQRALAGVAVIGFLVCNGFLENRLGQLAWHREDLWRILLLVMVAAWGLAVGEGIRFVHAIRARYRKAGSEVLRASSQEEGKHGA
jgi:hypothetical protein